MKDQLTSLQKNLKSRSNESFSKDDISSVQKEIQDLAFDYANGEIRKKMLELSSRMARRLPHDVNRASDMAHQISIFVKCNL